MSDVEVDNFQDEMDELERISAKLDTLNAELSLYKQNPSFDEEIIFTVEQKIERRTSEGSLGDGVHSCPS